MTNKAQGTFLHFKAVPEFQPKRSSIFRSTASSKAADSKAAQKAQDLGLPARRRTPAQEV